jgi:hypothetical protein
MLCEDDLTNTAGGWLRLAGWEADTGLRVALQLGPSGKVVFRWQGNRRLPLDDCGQVRSGQQSKGKGGSRTDTGTGSTRG